MTSGPIVALALARNDAISVWRAILGPTKVHRTRVEAPGTLRGLFGVSDTRNVGHGSDSSDSAQRELGTFFPDSSYAELVAEFEAQSNSDQHQDNKV
jgi:nucleoside-diphosphate kinase